VYDENFLANCMILVITLATGVGVVVRDLQGTVVGYCEYGRMYLEHFQQRWCRRWCSCIVFWWEDIWQGNCRLVAMRCRELMT
jgi:hypothetical protein